MRSSWRSGLPVSFAHVPSGALARWVSVALAAELLVAAGALAGPWALSAAAPAAVPVQAAARAAPAPVDGPVALSSPLWSGWVGAAPLPLDRQGALAVPATAGALGWWGDGPRPGAVGAAVVVGHVDLDGRMGVFARLATARVGTVVRVRSGVAVTAYRVTRVDRYAKTRFPSDVVYRPSDRAELRLVTCGGRFDRRTGHYADNVVVSAVRA